MVSSAQSAVTCSVSVPTLTRASGGEGQSALSPFFWLPPRELKKVVPMSCPAGGGAGGRCCRCAPRAGPGSGKGGGLTLPSDLATLQTNSLMQDCDISAFLCSFRGDLEKGRETTLHQHTRQRRIWLCGTLPNFGRVRMHRFLALSGPYGAVKLPVALGIQGHTLEKGTH